MKTISLIKYIFTFLLPTLLLSQFNPLGKNQEHINPLGNNQQTVNPLALNKQSQNPLSQKSKQVNLSNNQLLGSTKGKIYRHPTGVSFWYPDQWKLRELEGIVELYPPDSGTTQNNFEFYYLTGEDITGEGIFSPDHPLVHQALTQEMMKFGNHLGVYFQRSGNIKKIDISQGKSKGICQNWTASSNIGRIIAKTYVTIQKQYALSLCTVGVERRLKQREDLVRKIFTSFGVGEGKNDPAIVGTWHLMSVSALSNDSPFETAYSKAKAVNESKSKLTFYQNGQWIRKDSEHFLAGAGSLWVESKENSTSRGKWNADGNGLFMLWENKSFADYRYQIRGNKLVIETGKERQVWER